MSKKSFKKILSLLLSAMLVLSSASITAFAAEPADPSAVVAGPFSISRSDGKEPDASDFSYENNLLTVLTSDEIIISNTNPETATASYITVAQGVNANITLAGINIAASNSPAVDLTNAGAVTIKLKDTNTAIGGVGYAGIKTASKAESPLVITSADGDGSENGTLIARSLEYTGSSFYDEGGGAGIGGNSTERNSGDPDADGKYITIAGGTIIAEGGNVRKTKGGAGIGGGYSGFGENITITGGNVTATGKYYNAGIGGCRAKNITISGGTVKAYGGDYAAGIGSEGYVENITISGGTVSAVGALGGAAIGGGSNGYARGINITGGNVTATKLTEHGAGIGGGGFASSGWNSCEGEVSISGDANVTVYKSGEGSGIGAGDGSSYAIVKITDNAQVTVNCTGEATGIGGERLATEVNDLNQVEITGGNVTVNAADGDAIAGTEGWVLISGENTVVNAVSERGSGISALLGKIIITGGNVTGVTKNNVNNRVAGIGGGQSTVSISGGVVNAISEGLRDGTENSKWESSSGLGEHDCKITITGGAVNVVSNSTGIYQDEAGDGKLIVLGGVLTVTGAESAIGTYMPVYFAAEQDKYGNNLDSEFVHLTYGNTEQTPCTTPVEWNGNPLDDWSAYKYIKIQPVQVNNLSIQPHDDLFISHFSELAFTVDSEVVLPEDYTGEPLEYDLSNSVIWSISGNNYEGTFIEDRILTLFRYETAEEITVTASLSTGISDSVVVKTDFDAPQAKITVGEHSWNELLSDITFGTFFNNRQQAEITATDSKSGTDKIYYYISDTAIQQADLEKTVEWTEYTGGIDLETDDEYIVYVKVTDKTGNTGYYSSDGIILDSVSPVISVIVDGKEKCEPKTVKVEDKYLDSVTVDGEEIELAENGTFVLPGNGRQTIVATDKAGNRTSAEVESGHKWNNPVFEWADDNLSATAYFTCANDENHTASAQATVTSKVKNPPSRTENGIMIYTACVTLDNQTFTEEKEVIIPATATYVTVIASSLGSVTLNGEPIALGGVETRQVEYGKSYTLSAFSYEGAEFVGWSYEGKLISTDFTYTTTAFADATYLPIFDETGDESFHVTFVDMYGNVIAIYDSVAIEQESFNFPDTPVYSGMKFAGWSDTLEDVKAYKTSGIVYAYYEVDATQSYTVNAPDCYITIGGHQYEDSAEAKYNDVVTVTPKNETAALWKINNAVVGYGDKYEFCCGSDLTISYDTEETDSAPAVVSISETKGDDFKVKFLATRFVPDGYTLVESGFIYGKDMNESDLVLENVGTVQGNADSTVKQIKNNNKSPEGQFALTYGVTDMSAPACARPYIIYTDAAGTAYAVYGTMLSEKY